MRFDHGKTLGALVLFGLYAAGGDVGRAYADLPAGWGGGGKGYELSVDRAEKHEGQASGSIKSLAPERFGTLTGGFKADDYRGKRLRMSAHVKSNQVEDWSGLWLRVDGKDQIGVAFDNMHDRQIKGTNDWKPFELVIDVPDDAAEIHFGVLLSGKGQVWVDAFRFEEVGPDVKTTGRAVQPMKTDRPLRENLPQQPVNLDFEQ